MVGARDWLEGAGQEMESAMGEKRRHKVQREVETAGTCSTTVDTIVIGTEGLYHPTEHNCERNVQGAPGQRRIQEIIR